MAVFLLINSTAVRAQTDGEIGVRERLGQSVPLDLNFRDEKGSIVRLGDVVNKPTVVTLVYYSCSHFCPQMLLGLAEVLGEVKMSPGKDYRIVTVSIDDADTPEDASGLKMNYTKATNMHLPGDAWRFLTGDKESVMKIANALGVTFKKETHGFIHPEAIVFLSPQGKITSYIYPSKYSFGVGQPMTFSPVDFTKALTCASEGTVEAGVRSSQLLCFPHEPGRQERFFDILKVLGGLTLIAAISLFVYLSLTGRKKSKGDDGGA